MKRPGILLLTALMTGMVMTGMGAELPDHPGWFFEPDTTVITLHDCRALVSHGQRLLVWYVKESVDREESTGPGSWDGRELTRDHTLPRMGHVPRTTSWRGHLVLAGSYQPPVPADEQPGRFTSGDRILLHDGISYRELQPGFSGRVNALISHRDTLLAAGRFSLEGEVGSVSLVFWNGSSWQAYGAQPLGGGEARVQCLASRGDTLLVGGVFERMGPVKAWNIALHDGQAWQALGSGANGAVEHLAFSRGQIFVQGRFNCIGGRQARNLAGWDGENWYELPWPGDVTHTDTPLASARILGTPEGLFVLCSVGDRENPLNSGVFRWVDGRWDETMPSLHGTRWDIRIKAEYPSRRSRYFAPGEEIPVSRPHFDPRPSRREMVTVPDIRNIEAMAWHQNRLLVVISRPTETTHYFRDRQLLAWSGDQWDEVISAPAPSRRKLGPYRHGQLVLAGKFYADRELILDQGGQKQVLGNLYKEGGDIQAYHIQGDSIFVAGQFGFLDEEFFHHTALYDGQQWLPLGGGIPFDSVNSCSWHPTRHGLILSGQMRNQDCAPIFCVMIWNGERWDILNMAKHEFRSPRIMVSNHQELFRAHRQAQPFEILRGPDHEPHQFPNSTYPTIEQWDGRDWVPVWQGNTGGIQQFFPDGREIWASLDFCVEGNFVHFDGQRWSLMDAPTLDPFGECPRPWFLNGREFIVWSNKDFPQDKARRVCILDGGRWQATGPRLLRTNRPKVLEGRAVFEDAVVMTAEDEWATGRLEWDGTLGPLTPVPFVDLDALRAWREVCAASDQRDRFDLDLPWPRGLTKPKWNPDLPPNRRPGWYLSGWPEGMALDRIVAEDDGTLILPASSSLGLVLNFPWEPMTYGEIEFEFRLLPPTSWFDEGDSPSLECESGQCPVLRVSGDEAPAGIQLWAKDSRWHKIRRPFQPPPGHFTGEESPFLSIHAGRASHGPGRLEIRGLKFHKHDQPEGRRQAQDLARHLQEYPWSREARPRIQPVLDNLRGGKMTTPNGRLYYIDFIGSGLSGNDSLGKALMRREEKPAFFGSRWQQIDQVVENQGGRPVRSGWLPGGGRYFPVGSLDKLVTHLTAMEKDPQALQLVEGLALDFRNTDRRWALSTSRWRDTTREAWSYFVSHDFTWMEIQNDHDVPKRETVRVLTGAQTWEHTPVVAIIDHTTPGLLALLLNSTPGLTTIGLPSAPVDAPTRKQQILDGRFVNIPWGRIFDNRGQNVSYRRIHPDIELPLNAEYSAAIREAMNVLGLEPDPDASFCPVEME